METNTPTYPKNIFMKNLNKMATLYNVIKTLESIALQQPNIRSAGENDLYGFMNGNPEIKYGVFYVTQGQHTSTEGWDIWNLHLFIIDRLTGDKSNELRIESNAKQVLDNIINIFCSRYDAEVVQGNKRKYHPFVESFKDRCAGVYVDVQLMTPKDVLCADE